MTAIILTHNHYSEEHLQEVISQMEIMGTPTIKAVWMECYGAYAALEGCHRIRAAKHLGLTPIIEEVEYDANVDDLNIDAQDCDTVADIVDNCHRRIVIEF